MEQRARSRERREHRSRFMRRRFFGFALSTLLLALAFPLEAQQQAKVPKIGLSRSPSRCARFRARVIPARAP